MNFFPNRAPRRGPDTGITFVDLNYAVINQNVFNLHNRGPESRFNLSVMGSPEASIGEIFGHKNGY